MKENYGFTIEAPAHVHNMLTEAGFKMNGYDYYSTYAMTNLEQDWDEEVYVSKKKDGYEVYCPDREKLNKFYKTESGLLNYLTKQFHIIN